MFLFLERDEARVDWARPPSIRAGINLQNIASRLMQPGHNDDIVAHARPIESLCCERLYFQPDMGSSFRSLHGRFAAGLEDGSDYGNWPKLLNTFGRFHMPPPEFLFRYGQTLSMLYHDV